jgi:50S ribosomal subunit-associated GTPase HflX
MTVEKILSELGLGETPRITVLNKIDLAAPSEEDVGEFASVISALREPDLSDKDSGEEAVLISAAKGWGLHGLLEKMEETLLY